MSSKVSAIIILITALSLATVGCTEDNEDFSTHTGTIQPMVMVSGAIVSPEAQSVADLGVDIPSASSLTFELTDDTGAHSGRWPSVVEFPTDSRFQTGRYTVSASSGDMTEGFERATFYGSTTFTLDNDLTARPVVTATVANALVTARYDRSLQQAISDITLTFHSSEGGAYLPYPATETRPLFIMPGDISIIADIDMVDGRSVSIAAATIADAQAAHHYIVSLMLDSGGDYPILEIAVNGGKPVMVELTDALLDGTPPQVEAIGFVPGEALSVVEGEIPSEPVGMHVSGLGLEAAMLTTVSPSLIAAGFPAELDLINAPDEVMAKARAMGLNYEDGRLVLNELIAAIDYSYGAEASTFTLVARDRYGRVNAPVTATVEIHDAEIEIHGFSQSVIGCNEATLYLSSRATGLQNSLEIRTLSPSGSWQRAEVVAATHSGNDNYVITFTLPEGTSDVPVRVYYCNRLKGESTIKRVSPDYSIDVDAFARAARIRVNADDASTTDVVTRYATVYSGDRKCTIMNRDPECGYIDIVGLSPNTTYTLRLSLVSTPVSPADFSNAVTARTEKTEALPNGSFEEVEKAIRYDNLPSGGRYSQTIVDIFNCLNHSSYHLDAPKVWANTNAKTFCTGARNHNTWYMQPSAMTSTDCIEEGFSLELVNVAWDPAGPQIPDYTQQGTPYLRYNPNVPDIAYRCAGRAWLGSYSYNATTGEETISEGVKFTSRPTSLNGYYKYMPGTVANNERALAMVKVWGTVDGRETIIAQARATLSISPDFSTFTVPINYDMFGVKATKICVILSASTHIGDIDYETSHVITYPDPQSATSTGNRLIVDNLSFSY